MSKKTQILDINWSALYSIAIGLFFMYNASTENLLFGLFFLGSGLWNPLFVWMKADPETQTLTIASFGLSHMVFKKIPFDHIKDLATEAVKKRGKYGRTYYAFRYVIVLQNEQKIYPRKNFTGSQKAHYKNLIRLKQAIGREMESDRIAKQIAAQKQAKQQPAVRPAKDVPAPQPVTPPPADEAVPEEILTETVVPPKATEASKTYTSFADDTESARPPAAAGKLSRIRNKKYEILLWQTQAFKTEKEVCLLFHYIPKADRTLDKLAKKAAASTLSNAMLAAGLDPTRYYNAIINFKPIALKPPLDQWMLAFGNQPQAGCRSVLQPWVEYALRNWCVRASSGKEITSLLTVLFAPDGLTLSARLINKTDKILPQDLTNLGEDILKALQ